MGRALALRADFNGPELRRLAKGSKDAGQSRRLLALAEIYDGGRRRKDLAHWIFEEFCISLEKSSVGRELRALGFRKISARPRHKGQNEFAVGDFKKTSTPSWGRSEPGSRTTPR